MKDFLSNAILYEKRVILEDYKVGNKKFYTENDFNKITFEYYCEIEEKNTTFQLGLEYPVNRFEDSNIPDSYFIKEKLDYVFTAICTCQSCKVQKVYFLLNVFSDKKVSQKIWNPDLSDVIDGIRIDEEDANIWIQKVGATPEIKISKNKIVSKFLDGESDTFYYKGLKALSQNLGVGSLAYVRKIVERELLNIVDEIKNLPDTDEASIQKLLDDYEKSRKVSTVYHNIFKFLPKSLQSLDINPIFLLHDLTSGGLHQYTEEESLNIAKKVMALLEFVILKINEEKSSLNDMRRIVKELRRDQN